MASVIGPLADEGVSVFCLSTNQEDYVMVMLVIFDSPAYLFLSFSLSLSLIQVKEKDIYKALSCLHPCFKLLAELERDIHLIENFSHDNNLSKGRERGRERMTFKFKTDSVVFFTILCLYLHDNACVASQLLLSHLIVAYICLCPATITFNMRERHYFWP